MALHFQFTNHVPQHYANAYAHVERVLGAELRNFNARVAQVNYLLLHTLYFVAEHKRIFCAGLRNKIIEHYALFGLFNGNKRVALFLEFTNSRFGRFVIFPRHGVLRAQRRFVHFGAWRNRTNSAENNFLDAKRIACSESRANIVLAADIVQYYNNRIFGYTSEARG